MNISFHFFWDKCPGVQLLGDMVVVYLGFLKESAKLFSRVAALFYSPTSKEYVILFIHILASFWCCTIFNFSYLDSIVIS